MRIESGGKVIVGTNSSNALEVFSTGDTEIGFSYATKGNIYAKIIGDITVANPLGGELAFQTATGGTLTERMRINSSGDVGIGTTPETAGPTWRTLFIGGAATIVSRQSASGYDSIFANNYYVNSSNQDRVRTTGPSSRMFLDGNNIRFQISPSTGAGGSPTWSEIMRVDDSGRVGIGTTAPRAKLEVNGELIAKDIKHSNFAVASLNTTGYTIATVTGGGNGSSAQIEFIGMGGTSGIVDVVYSCTNQSGNWYAYKKARQTPTLVDVDVTGHGTTTLSFVFKSLSGTYI